jgi:hypothetical protein
MLPQGENSDFQHHHFGRWLGKREVPRLLGRMIVIWRVVRVGLRSRRRREREDFM